METVSCNVDECNNSVSLENGITNPKKKRKRSKKQRGKEKQEFDQKDGEILTGSSGARADPSGSEVEVIKVPNVEIVEKQDGTLRRSCGEADAVNEEKEKNRKGKKKRKMDEDKPEEDSSAKVLQDGDPELVDNFVPLQDDASLIIDKEKTGVLEEGDGVSMKTKKEKKLKRKKKQRKNEEQEGESGGSNVNALQVVKSVETNQASVEKSSANVEDMQDADVYLVNNSVPSEDNVRLMIDNEKVGALGEGNGMSTEPKKKTKSKKRKKKEQESESGGKNVNELQVVKSVETNQVSAEMSSANVEDMQDVDGNLVDNFVPSQDNISLITDKEKVDALGGGNGVSTELKKKMKLKKKKVQEGESGGSNVNELQVKKIVETNQVSVELDGVNVKVLQDADVNVVDNSVLDKEKLGVLGEGGGLSMEKKKKKKRLRKRKNKEQEGESGGINANELQEEKSVEINQVSVEMSSIDVVTSEDLDGENHRKRSRLDGSLEENLELSIEDVQNNASLKIGKEVKKREKLRRKGKQKNSKEREGGSGSSNVNELQVEKCVESNQVSVEMSNVNVINSEGLDEENCRKRRCLDGSFEGNLESSTEDIQGRSPCCADKGEKVVSLDSTLGQVELREQASSKQVDVENPSQEFSTEISREKLVLIDSEEAVNLPISKGDIYEVTLPVKDFVAETSGEMNGVEQQVQDQHVNQTCIDNNSEVQDDNPKDEANAPCFADSNNSVLQTCALVINTDSIGAACPSKGVDESKDDVVVDVIDKENKTAQRVQHSLTESLEVKQSQKKLLILDVNGLLADIIPYENHVRRKPDAVVSGKAVFKRPFMDDFLQFCFDNFAVGVWSSRTKRNVEMVVDCLMGNSKEKLCFCWDQSHCTITKYTTIQNRDKPLVFKELKKLWEKLEPDLPWMKGEYNESNTLLLDDSPYKALLNPACTAIFPYSYEYTDAKDNSLGPGGDLRVYLEQLALAKNVQEYVQQNPFGQRAITSRNPSWGYYQKVIAAASSAGVTVLPR